VEFTIAAARQAYADVVVTDASVTPSTLIVGALTASADWDAEDLIDITAVAEAGTGNFRLHLARNGPIGGTFNYHYVKA
jgi:hypothetical protein